jgi:uncharacterized protein YjeT (DUF2065 family)
LSFAWGDFVAALAILLVLEGLLPFLNPGGAKRVFAKLANLADSELRIAGTVSVCIGLLVLFLVRS